jgi:hypothetical protein
MKKIYESELDELVLDFIKFSKSKKYAHQYNCSIHINYDVRQALEKIEVELRERIKAIEGKKIIRIPVQLIIGYLLDCFLKDSEEFDISAIVKEYSTKRRIRSEVKVEICSSKLSLGLKKELDKIYFNVSDQIKPKKKINIRYFIDYILVGYLEEFMTNQLF